MSKTRLTGRLAAVLLAIASCSLPCFAVSAPTSHRGAHDSRAGRGQAPPASAPARATTRLPASLRVVEQVAVSSGPEAARQVARWLAVPVTNDRVRVFATLLPGRSLATRRRVEALGGRVISVARVGGRMEALVPFDRLRQVALSDGVLRLEVRRRLQSGAVAILSEGVAATGAPDWASYQPPDGLPLGRPVKVAVVDGAFTGYEALLGTGLPAAVDTATFCGTQTPDIHGCTPGLTDVDLVHGTAVAEIVHQMAPNAQLLLAVTDLDDGSTIQQALEYARTVYGADLVTTSLGTRYDNRDGTSPFCGNARQLAGDGVVWTASAGNDGTACEHEGFSWSPSTAAALSNAPIPGGYGAVQSFPAQNVPYYDEFTLFAGQVHVVDLAWNSWEQTPTDDFDLFYYCDFGAGYQLVASSTDTQCGDPAAVPEEIVTYQNTSGGDLPCAYAVAAKATSQCPIPSNVRFDTWSTQSDPTTMARVCTSLEHATSAGTINDPADCPDVAAAGAVCVRGAGLEFYSSQGPTLDGRTKPDLCAPDATSGDLYGTSTMCPADCSATACEVGFSGTSAAAPHLAGALALLFEKVGRSFTMEQCVEILERRAGGGGVSPDNRCGRGALCMIQGGCNYP